MRIFVFNVHASNVGIFPVNNTQLSMVSGNHVRWSEPRQWRVKLSHNNTNIYESCEMG